LKFFLARKFPTGGGGRGDLGPQRRGVGQRGGGPPGPQKRNPPKKTGGPAVGVPQSFFHKPRGRAGGRAGPAWAFGPSFLRFFQGGYFPVPGEPLFVSQFFSRSRGGKYGLFKNKKKKQNGQLGVVKAGGGKFLPGGGDRGGVLLTAREIVVAALITGRTQIGEFCLWCLCNKNLG